MRWTDCPALGFSGGILLAVHAALDTLQLIGWPKHVRCHFLMRNAGLLLRIATAALGLLLQSGIPRQRCANTRLTCCDNHAAAFLSMVRLRALWLPK
jgi:hypothetical protein